MATVVPSIATDLPNKSLSPGLGLFSVATGTVGAPGTGLSYRQTLVDGSGPAPSEPNRGKPWRGVLWIALAAAVIYLILK